MEEQRKEKKEMTLRKWILIAAGLVLFLVPSALMAGEERPTASADVAFLSKYVWRGYELSEDSLVIQPSITVEYKGFGLNLWGNLDTDNYVTDSHEFNETDFTFSYDHSFGIFSLGLGYIYYSLDAELDRGSPTPDPGEIDDDTQEFYASGALDVLLSPTLTIYRDFDTLDTWYFNLAISHSFPMPKDLSLDLGASVAYYIFDDKDAFGNDSFFNDGTLSAALSIPVAEYFTVAPTLSYTFALSDDAKESVFKIGPNRDSGYLYGGVNVSMAF